jgi:sugar-phosphatase
VTFTAVISDLDGVLVDSMPATTRAWAAWGRRRGLDGAAIQAANHGRPARAVIAEHVAAQHVDADTEFLLDAEVSDTRDVIALPGADGVLALPVVAIATSCVAPLARARIAAAGLRAPEVVVTADQVRRGKPAPDSYLLAAERLGVDPADCVVLEDAPAGVAAGKAAGMAVWAVTFTHAAAELDEADMVADDLLHLLRRITRGAA